MIHPTYAAAITRNVDRSCGCWYTYTYYNETQTKEEEETLIFKKTRQDRPEEMLSQNEIYPKHVCIPDILAHQTFFRGLVQVGLISWKVSRGGQAMSTDGDSLNAILLTNPVS